MLNENLKNKIYSTAAWIGGSATTKRNNSTSIDDDFNVTVEMVYFKMLKELKSSCNMMGLKTARQYQEDLLSEGNLGLVKAVDTYDDKFSIKFDTYATRCIQNAMMTANIKLTGNNMKTESYETKLSEITTSSDKLDKISAAEFKEQAFNDEIVNTFSSADEIEKAKKELEKFLRKISILDKWNQSEKLGMEWIIQHIIYELSGEEFARKYNYSDEEMANIRRYADKAKSKLNNDVYRELFQKFEREGDLIPKAKIEKNNTIKPRMGICCFTSKNFLDEIEDCDNADDISKQEKEMFLK